MTLARNGSVASISLWKRPQGNALNTVWPDLDPRKRAAVVEEVFSIQIRLVKASEAFGGFGSLYFSEDITRFGFPYHFVSYINWSSEILYGSASLSEGGRVSEARHRSRSL
jgi:hypothetical protein